MTHCPITPCQSGQFDHLDRAGEQWLRERQVPVICTPHDSAYLSRRGLNVRALASGHGKPLLFLNETIRTVACMHGRGLAHYVSDAPGTNLSKPGGVVILRL